MTLKGTINARNQRQYEHSHATMSTQSTWQVSQLAANQAATEISQQDFTYSESYPCYESFDFPPWLPDEQCSQLSMGVLCNSTGIASLPTTTWGWPAQDNLSSLPAMIPDDSLLQIQPAVEDQNVLFGPSSEEEGLKEFKQVISGLQNKAEKLEELFVNLQNEFRNFQNDFRNQQNE